jgi:PhnB protein
MKVHEMFPYLCVKDAEQAIAFYSKAFGAKEKFRLAEPSGRIGHAELDFGKGMTLMICEEFPEYGITAPSGSGASSVTIHLHVDNADGVIEAALAAGAKLHMKAQDQFYGERSGSFFDPFGHRWNVGHHIEPVTPEEMQRRYTEMMQSG